jgi:hypothetical protein
MGIILSPIHLLPPGEGGEGQAELGRALAVPRRQTLLGKTLYIAERRDGWRDISR